MSQNISYTFNNQTLKKWLGFRDKVSSRLSSSSSSDDEDMDDEETDLTMQNLDPERKKSMKGAEESSSAEVDADGYLKFQMPWSLSVSYGISMREDTSAKINPKRMRYPYRFNQTLNFSGNVRISEGWNINFSSGYDFNYKKLSMTTVSLARDLHCFSMSCSMVISPYTSFNFLFAAKAGTLADALRWKKQSSYGTNVEWY
jgi:outer membrane receptor for ferrienterochelin and colicin